jgi:arsenite methyltransferase
MATLRFDEEAARKLGAAYMTADLVEQRRATLRWLSLQPGDSILDVGCGPGFLCAELAEAVGEGGRVLGIDISDDLLAFAMSANKRPWLTFRHGDAGALDLQNSSFDAAVMAQVLEYVVDTDACLAELHRILRRRSERADALASLLPDVWNDRFPASGLPARPDRHCSRPARRRFLSADCVCLGEIQTAMGQLPVRSGSTSAAAILTVALKGRSRRPAPASRAARSGLRSWKLIG